MQRGQVRRIETPNTDLIEPLVAVVSAWDDRVHTALVSWETESAIEGDRWIDDLLGIPHILHLRVRATLPSALLSDPVATLDIGGLPSASRIDVRHADDLRQAVQDELDRDLERVMASVGYRRDEWDDWNYIPS